jgi:hypothetical protein
MENNYARLQDRGDSDDPDLGPDFQRGTPNSILSPSPIGVPEIVNSENPEENSEDRADREITEQFEELDQQIIEDAKESAPNWDWD